MEDIDLKDCSQNYQANVHSHTNEGASIAGSEEGIMQRTEYTVSSEIAASR